MICELERATLFERDLLLLEPLLQALHEAAAVCLLGPRQVGKTALALEVKRSMVPKADWGFHAACADLHPAQRYAVYPGVARFPTGQDVRQWLGSR